MTYFGELKQNWRGLSSASIGVAVGLALFAYTSSIFAPHLVREFGWSKAQFALIGLTSSSMLLWTPLIGRLVDFAGVRRVAIVGVVGLPLCFIAFSLMTGSFTVFVILTIVQLLVGTCSSVVVYTRIVAERFVLARGLALTIITCGPALVGALGGPFLSDAIDAFGWRMGYRIVAVFIALFGALALLLVPPSTHKRGDAAATTVANSRQTVARAGSDYRLVFRAPVFWVILVGMMLCALPTTLHTAQFKLMLLDHHLTSEAASLMISLYAAGTVAGRLGCGIALDRLPAHLVAAVSMGLPAIGFVILASGNDTSPGIAMSVLFMGLSQGAEGDLVSFLVARSFAVEIYGTVFGLVSAGFGVAAAAGAILLSYSIKLSGSYSPFLLITAMTILIGSTLFLLLGSPGLARKIEVEPAG